MPQYQLVFKGGLDPSGEGIPSTFQGHLDKIRQYMEISLSSNEPDSDVVHHILVQDTEPTGADANDLWVKTSAGRPVGLFAYQGSEFRPIVQNNNGPSANKPTSGVPGEFYYATDIKVMLMWDDEEGWITQEGSPGDVKSVWVDSDQYPGNQSVERALVLNPGWEHFADASGRALVGIDQLSANNDYHKVGNQFGVSDVELETTQVPPHKHKIATVGNAPSGQTLQSNPDYSLSTLNFHSNNYKEYDLGALVQDSEENMVGLTGVSGGNSQLGADSHENRPPSLVVIFLRKKGY